MKKGIIYKYTFPNGKIYIGQTIDLDKRHYQHQYYAKNAKGNRSLCDIAIAKYGEPKLEVIEEIIGDDNKPYEFKQALNEAEVKWINEYNATDRSIGYNIQHGGHTSNEENYILEEIYLTMLDKREDEIKHIRATLDSITEKIKNKIKENTIIKKGINHNGAIFTIDVDGHLTISFKKPPMQDIAVSCECGNQKLNFVCLKGETKIICEDISLTKKDYINNISYTPNEDELYVYKHRTVCREEFCGNSKIKRGYGVIPENNGAFLSKKDDTFKLNTYDLTKEEKFLWFKYRWDNDVTFNKLMKSYLKGDMVDAYEDAKNFYNTLNTIEQTIEYFIEDVINRGFEDIIVHISKTIWEDIENNKEKYIEEFFNSDNF